MFQGGRGSMHGTVCAASLQDATASEGGSVYSFNVASSCVDYRPAAASPPKARSNSMGFE